MVINDPNDYHVHRHIDASLSVTSMEIWDYISSFKSKMRQDKHRAIQNVIAYCVVWKLSSRQPW